MTEQTIGIIVGAVIAIVASCIPLWWAHCSAKYQAALAQHEQYASVLRGLIPELQHLHGCATELTNLYKSTRDGGDLICPTKELNTDFLQDSRLKMTSHPRSENLFRSITEAYRDCVHTNDMMRRFEEYYKGVMQFPNRRDRILNGPLGPTLASCESVSATITKALDQVSKEASILDSHKPKIHEFLTW